MRELAGPNTVYHPLVVWAVGVLRRVAGVLEDLEIVDAEDVLAVGDQLLTLHRKACTVHLILRGNPDVDGDLLNEVEVRL